MEDNQKETNWVVSLVFQKMVLGNPSSMQNISNNVSIQKAKTEQEAF